MSSHRRQDHDPPGYSVSIETTTLEPTMIRTALLALYDDAGSFLKRPARVTAAKADTAGTTLVFRDLAPGGYGFSVFHDARSAAVLADPPRRHRGRAPRGRRAHGLPRPPAREAQGTRRTARRQPQLRRPVPPDVATVVAPPPRFRIAKRPFTICFAFTKRSCIIAPVLCLI